MSNSGTTEKLTRLLNLLERGRRLHYENANTLAARVLRGRLPAKTPAMADLVYRAVQLVFALTFIEERGYLAGQHYDTFTDQLFAQVAGPHAQRVHGLVTTYAQSLPEPARFSAVIAQDLCASLLGKVEPAYAQALGGTAAAMQRTTQLYCAMTFDDRTMVARLQ